MSTWFFSYTIFLIVICVASGFASLTGYRLTRHPAYIATGVFFVCYFFDVCVIFRGEHAAQNIAYTIESFYQINTPIFSAFMASIISGCMWYALCEVLEKHNRFLQFIPTAILFVSSICVVMLLEQGPLSQWLFYTLRQLMIFAGLIYAVYAYVSSSDDLYRRRLLRHKKPFIMFWVLTIFILLEDTYIVFIFNPHDPQTNFALLLALSERNFSENLMMIAISYLTIRAVFKTIDFHRDLQPLTEGTQGSIERKIDALLPDYIARYGLTKREGEVLHLILQNKTNQCIAAEFMVSEGTVKTHVHNILKKRNVEDRQQLIKDFWGERA